MNEEPLNEQLSRTRRDFMLLYEISQAMRTTLELNHILYIILTGVTSHSGLGYNRAILFLLNDEGNMLEPRMAIGPKSGKHAQEIWEHIRTSNQTLEDLIKKDKLAQNTEQTSLYKDVKNLKISVGTEENNLLSKAILNGEPLHILEHELSEHAGDIFLKMFESNELVIVPLKIKDKTIGLITADNIYTHRRPSKDDLRMFMMLANQAALAIENSRLYELVKHRSHTDPVTNVWNHGFFQQRLSGLLDEIVPLKGNLSLAILDIDNFKTLNDTYGHQQGDLILKEMARLLSAHSREEDYLCRYGGEEFSLILPYTSKQQAASMAEKAREKISQHAFPAGSSDQKLNVTVSIGVATYPDDAGSKEELIDKADRAMYKAKHDGKNKTATA